MKNHRIFLKQGVKMNLYFGDIHNHCGISYGYGALVNALTAARNHLDFCNVTGHALWPDIHDRKPETEYLVDFHMQGFKKLYDNWGNVTDTINKYNEPGNFVTFQGYEMHSKIYGDHHILSKDNYIPIISDAQNPKDLVEKLKPKNVMAIPHHVAYTPGYRGIDWDSLDQTISPVVEVFSKHGCGISDTDPYPYLHTMGPRDSRNTVITGLQKGHVFGFIASTDHHAGYPGSYGDGRIAVYAKEKTREAIWEAIKSRHTYAVTGDKIQCMFKINGELMGSIIPKTDKIEIFLNIIGCDFLDRIVLFKNSYPFRTWNFCIPEPKVVSSKYKVRIETGWGKNTEPYAWHGKINMVNGKITGVETCFRGKSILAPSKDSKANDAVNFLNNKIINITDESVEYSCETFMNVSNLHSQTCSVICEIQGDHTTQINVDINGIKHTYTLTDLIRGSRTFHMSYFNTQAVLIHQAVPEFQYSFESLIYDHCNNPGTDYYHVSVRQYNGQMAWISPVFIR